MKPYIEKNDGVPDNNRYSEALEAAKETVEALNKLTDQALAQYTALVDSAVAGHITDERVLEHIMDGLLDFGDDLRFLEIYKRLCRHIFYKHPQMVGEHIYLWRMHHKNTLGDKKTGPVPGYHLQRVSQNTISGYLEYISDHDLYRNMHPLYPVQSKKNSPPPMKGTKRYRKEQKRAAKKARRQSIAHVLTLIENLDTQARVARSM